MLENPLPLEMFKQARDVLLPAENFSVILLTVLVMSSKFFFTNYSFVNQHSKIKKHLAVHAENAG